MTRSRLPFALACLFAASLAGAQGTATRRAPDGFTLFAGGDLLGPYRPTLAVTPAMKPVLDKIARADAAFANQEGNAFDMPTFRGFLAAENGGGYPLHTPSVVRSFKALGLDVISRANNHGMDYGLEGMIATDRLLDEVGLAHAGTGMSLEAARAPAYADTPRGRVALVAAASTFTPMSAAGNPARGAGPRPGVNPLHVDAVTLVLPDEMESLRRIANRAGSPGQEGLPPDVSQLRLGDATYKRADAPGLTYRVSGDDRAALVASVATARRNADVVVFSIHAHETHSGGQDDLAPADFLPPLFHDLIDAGADAIIRHGPHAVMGVELYKGKPIFYGLGSLIFDLARSFPIASEGPAESRIMAHLPDQWYDSAVAEVEYQGGSVKHIRLTPIMFDDQGETRGNPRIATGADAQRILQRIREGSAPFGTRVEIRDDVGLITP